MTPELEAANAWLKTEKGSAELRAIGPFAKPMLVRAFVVGWCAKKNQQASVIAERKSND